MTTTPTELLWRRRVIVSDHFALLVSREDLGDGAERITGKAFIDASRFGDWPEVEYPSRADVERDVSAALGFAVRVDSSGELGGMLTILFSRLERPLMATATAKRTTKPPGETGGDPRSIELSIENAKNAPTHSDPAIPFLLLPIDRIERWEGNPRKHFDEKELQELADSIKVNGVLQPILVRPKQPVPNVIPDKYLLVVGERRWRAAKLAGQATIPAIIRELTDLQCLEINLVEQMQRQDLDPLEEAAGYQRLVDEHGYSVEEVAQKLNKSKTYVYGRLKLCLLPKKAQALVARGELPPATAELIARIPGEKARKEAAEELLNNTADDDEVPSYRWVKDEIQRRWMVELKQAPFQPAEASLVPGAGACTSCPKRTGNCPDLYPDSRADLCTDPACYRAKVEAWGKRQVQAARDSGKTVLTKKESEAVFNPYGRGELSYRSGYLDLAQKCYDDRPKCRTYEQLIGKEVEDLVVLAFDREGHVHRLVKEDLAAVKAALKAKIGAKANHSAPTASEARWKKEQAQRRAEDLLKKEAARRCMGLAAERAEAIARRNLLSVGCLTDGSEGGRLLRRLAVELVGRCWDETNRMIVLRRGLDKPKTGHAGQNRDPIAKLALTLDPAQVVGLIAELLCGHSAAVSSYEDKEHKAFWELLGIDRKKVLAEVQKEKAKPKVQTASAQSNGNGKHATNGHAKPAREPKTRRSKPAAAAETEEEEPAGKPWPADMSHLPDPVTRETKLLLLMPFMARHAGHVTALAAVELDTVGDLLDQAKTWPQGVGEVQKVYSLLREVPGLGAVAANAIGDALVDAGLIGAGKAMAT